MQPTTNTPFERFAFAATIFLSISMPFLVIGLVLVATLLSLDADDGTAIGLMIAIVSLTVTFGLPAFCVVCATKIERDHLKALAQAEIELSDIILSDMRTLPSNWEPVNTVFVTENVVIANDFLKSFRWVFRKIIGGESKSFSRLLARARREATVRVLRKAKECGANVVWNIRYEACAVQTMFAKEASNNVSGVEVLAYATAFNIVDSQ